MNKSILLCAATGVFLATMSVAASADHSKAQVQAAQEFQRLLTYVPKRYQTANVFDANLGPDVRQGAAWMIRSKNGIRGRIMTNVPTAGDPYTLWIVVFNRPSACVATPCGADEDFANEDVGVSVFNGTGAVSASNGLGGGVFNADFELVPGKLPKDLFLLFGSPKGVFRDNGFRAEIHLVVDKHPSIAPGPMSWIADLTTTNFPGAGSATNESFAVFLPCPGSSCPDSVY